MADLGTWLGDLMRRGLASLPHHDRRPWLDAADRLVDAYAFEAARELRELSLIPGGRSDWPKLVLPRLGRLALLCEGFGRFDDLSPEEQGDMLAAAGVWPQPGQNRAVDDWLVCGRSESFEGKKQYTRTWLWGRATGRWAMLLDQRTAGRLEGVCYPTGAMVAGAVACLPSAWPLAARPLEGLRFIGDAPEAAGMATTIEQAVAGYASALAANPWLRVFPAALGEVFIEPVTRPSRSIEWRVRDRGGHLIKLPDEFAHGWRLLALAADRPIALFGEWDGEIFTPLSVFSGGWRVLAAWKGLP
jgi:hypothetical protein